MSSQSKCASGAPAGSGFGVIAATAFAAVGSIALVLLSGLPVEAADPTTKSSQTIAPDAKSPAVAPAARRELSTGGNTSTSPRRRAALPTLEPRRLLGPADEIAALEAVQIALSEVGDGASYVWHRNHGRLSGVVKPTTSFRDPGGRICRHVHVVLTSGDYARRAEGIACRDGEGVWSLDG